MTIPVVRHPSTTRIVREALRGGLDDIVVGRTVPHPRPSRFVTASRFGGAAGTVVSDRPIIGVEVWAGDPDAAEDLALDALHVLQRLAGTVVDGVTIYRVAVVSAPRDLPHPSGQPRFAFSVEMHVRASP